MTKAERLYVKKEIDSLVKFLADMATETGVGVHEEFVSGRKHGFLLSSQTLARVGNAIDTKLKSTENPKQDIIDNFYDGLLNYGPKKEIN